MDAFALIVVFLVVLFLILYGQFLVSGLFLISLAFISATEANVSMNISGGSIMVKGQKKSRYSGYEYTCDELKGFTLDPDFVDAMKSGDYKKIIVSHLYHPSFKRPEYNNKVISRVLNTDAPRLKYTRRTGRFKRQLHWGQLKLFLTEIEFINLAIKRYGKDSKFYVLYVGAAPGNHTTELAAMYNDNGISVYFDLWDGNPYVCRPIPGRIEIHQSLFFDKNAEFYRAKFDKLNSRSTSDSKNNQKTVVLLISDIRSAGDEKAVAFDMRLQLGWWKTLEPDMCMYKFRLPWSPGKTTYADGEIYIQPFPGITSSETRLIIDKRIHGMKMKEYDNTIYEEQCFYHNNMLRGCPYYPTQLFSGKHRDLSLERDGICNCYDCMSMAVLIHEYLDIVGKPNSLADVIKYAEHLERKTGGGTGRSTLLAQTLDNFKTAIEIGSNYKNC
jgi:hypothetical protein